MIAARAIKPGAFKSSVFREEELKAAKTIGKDALDDHNRTIANWERKSKVKFVLKIEIDEHSIRITISTKDKIWHYVDKGTPAHLIKAKHRRGLLFKAGSKPKTTPDIVGAFPGKAGTDWVNPKVVHHPGTEARNFTKHIEKTTQKELARVTRNALDRAARRSGHEIK